MSDEMQAKDATPVGYPWPLESTLWMLWHRLRRHTVHEWGYCLQYHHSWRNWFCLTCHRTWSRRWNGQP